MSSSRVALLDFPWLALESRPHHMHIAGLLICRLPSNAEPTFVSTLVREMGRHRAANHPLNQRVRRDGLNRIWPQWESVDALNLNYHLREWAVPAPGTGADLEHLVATLHEQPLDMTQPPWQIHVIDGVRDNRFAIYAKFHHALTDGLGAIRILDAALTPDPTQRDMPPLWAAAKTYRQPGPRPQHSHASSLINVPRALAAVVRGRRQAPRALPYAAPRTFLNTAVTARRQIATFSLDIARLRSLAAVINGTVNDALLAVCATGLRAYLLEQHALPRRPLTAAVPVSLRPAPGAADRGRAGNALSFAFINLATTDADHRERTRLVVDSARDAKEVLTDVPEELRDAYTIFTMAPFIGTQLIGLGALTPPMFNLAISNFAGPHERRFYNGAEVEAIHPVSILQSGQALNITALSYGDQLNITVTACPDVVPKPHRLADTCTDALAELEAAYAATE
jgi:diacylglycerol O-acyltransferase